MPTAYLLITCDLDRKSEVLEEINRLPGILESTELDAAYDILVKLNRCTAIELKDTIKSELKKIPDIKSVVTLVVIEDQDRGHNYPEDNRTASQ
jgi:DNA-binding Lrp family transcriptional regulator